MERAVNAMNDAYEDFLSAMMAMVPCGDTASGRLRTPERDKAMQAFKDKLELFRASTDRAEDLVLSAQRALIPAFASLSDSNVDDVNPTPEAVEAEAPPDTVADSASVPAAAAPSSPSEAVPAE